MDLPGVVLEYVDWVLENGQDENGNKLEFKRLIGENAERLFIKAVNPELPLKISVSITSSCEQEKDKIAKNNKTFTCLDPLLGGKNKAEKGEVKEYSICQEPAYGEFHWETSGVIVFESEKFSSIRFDQPGENTVDFVYYDCQGNEQKKSMLVQVSENNFSSGSMELTNVKSFKAFPNPASNGLLQIDIQDLPEEGGLIELYNLDGELLLQQYIVQNQIVLDTKNFISGIYILRFKTEKEGWIAKVGINLN